MKLYSLKYIIVCLLLVLFVSKGVVETLPAIIQHASWQRHQEMKLNSEQENKEEKTAEKEFQVKEFIGGFYHSDLSSLRYALLSQTHAHEYTHRVKAVFLSIATPPPKWHD